ncbi:ribosome biogenesis protein [Candidatus Woesearchaeota archaeon]|nr:ribosome biogenesis protein [Candidatus Woesearchaeota archaeon]
MKLILQCKKCGTYTFQKKHCDTTTENPKPAKYSPEDKYAKYRRMAMKDF